ncbi:hypothetical protein TREVI0001_2413 [Treponema vincentii ATCC 35580]|uniref:Uncharacterized protein n=1 Tax=Treponema vincentii ATCC 35580 TaxID=596324 RepID=C8PSM4_9SPIR|nr:hypothetical protein TREVI0001_2413 [Treponema vincentii ATCC 35580]
MFRNEHGRLFLNDAIRGGRGTAGIKPSARIKVLGTAVKKFVFLTAVPFLYYLFWRYCSFIHKNIPKKLSAILFRRKFCF